MSEGGNTLGVARAPEPYGTGVKVLRYQIGAYVVAAACYAIAGVLLAGFVGYASPTATSDYLLPSIAAVVVGGTPFTGVRESVVASGAAALFMAQLGEMVLALGAGLAAVVGSGGCDRRGNVDSACSVQTFTFETEASNEREVVKGQPI